MLKSIFRISLTSFSPPPIRLSEQQRRQVRMQERWAVLKEKAANRTRWDIGAKPGGRDLLENRGWFCTMRRPFIDKNPSHKRKDNWMAYVPYNFTQQRTTRRSYVHEKEACNALKVDTCTFTQLILVRWSGWILISKYVTNRPHLSHSMQINKYKFCIEDSQYYREVSRDVTVGDCHAYSVNKSSLILDDHMSLATRAWPDLATTWMCA